MQSFMEAIVRMGIFMICAQVLIHFRPNGSYEKYMKLLVSVMVLVQIFFPVMNLFLGEGQEMEERVAWFEEKIEESRKEALENAGEAEGVLNRMTLEELRRQLSAQSGSEDASEAQSKVEDASDTQSETEGASKAQEVSIDRIEVEIGEN